MVGTVTNIMMDEVIVPDLVQVFLSLSNSIRSLRKQKPRVPPPKICDGVNYEVVDFYFFFERFATAVYGDDKVSWLQVLPDFLSGNLRDIVDSFGINQYYTYDQVKEIVIEHSKVTSSLGGSEYFDFFRASRREGETLLCFSIRLLNLARKTPGTTSQFRHLLVRDKLYECLPLEIRNKLDVHYCLKEEGDISIEDFVGNATILEKCSQSISPPLPSPLPTMQNSPAVFSVNSCKRHTQPLRTRKCWRCGSPKHLKNACPRLRPGRLAKGYTSQGRSRFAQNCPRGSTIVPKRVTFASNVDYIASGQKGAPPSVCDDVGSVESRTIGRSWDCLNQIPIASPPREELPILPPQLDEETGSWSMSPDPGAREFIENNLMEQYGPHPNLIPRALNVDISRDAGIFSSPGLETSVGTAPESHLLSGGVITHSPGINTADQPRRFMREIVWSGEANSALDMNSSVEDLSSLFS